jgi:hypothetical protein
LSLLRSQGTESSPTYNVETGKWSFPGWNDHATLLRDQLPLFIPGRYFDMANVWVEPKTCNSKHQVCIQGTALTVAQPTTTASCGVRTKSKINFEKYIHHIHLFFFV